MDALIKIFKSYGDNFLVAVGFWPLVSSILTLPLLAYLYHRNGRLSIVSILTAYLSVLYILGLGCFTLYPLPSGTEGLGITYGVTPQLIPLTCLTDIIKDGLPAVFQIVANVALFIPLGIICGRFLKLQLPASIVIGFAISLLIEITQLTGLFGAYPYAYRMFDVDDLLTNTTGTVIGWYLTGFLARALPPSSTPADISRTPSFIRRFVCFWIDMSIIAIPTIIMMGIGVLALHLLFTKIDPITGLPATLMGLAVLLLLTWILGAFAGVEVIYPWRHDGQTPGGKFVRMTFETKDRDTSMRALFYILRVITIIFAIVFPLLMVPALMLFYFFARKMPYDYL